jgi:twitching motility protein PilI
MSNLLKPSEILNRKFIQPLLEVSAEEEITTVRRLGFKISDLNLLLAENIISELTDLTEICRIPNTTSWLLGLINLRGNLVPIFDLVTLLDLEQNSEHKMLLILGNGNTAAGVIIDGLPAHQILDIKNKLKSLPALPSLISQHIPSGYRKDKEFWFNFDYFDFFLSLSPKVAL